MRLLRGPEINFDTQVNLYVARFEPTPAPWSEMRRLLDMDDSQYPFVEGNRLSLAVWRHC